MLQSAHGRASCRRLLTLLLLLLSGPASAARDGEVVHVPPAGAIAGGKLELVAETAGVLPTLRAHYRRAGSAAYAELELVRRDDRHWVAVLPPAAVEPPGLEYYLEADGAQVFASAHAPHLIPIELSAEAARRAEELHAVASRRSRVRLSTDWVDYGTRTREGVRLVDRYYRVDADFAYRLLTYPLEQLRVGYTRLLGDTEAADPAQCEPQRACTREAGFKVGGWFELGLATLQGLRLDTRVLLMATQSGFKVGGRAEVRLGDRDGTHLAVAFESMADVGMSGQLRLGWGTVPQLPMAATIEITDLPETHRSNGVRLFYDLARSVGGGVQLGVRVGYAARTQTAGGITGGGNVQIDF